MRENNQNPVSTWPLFEYMTFLEGHIRPRKSYKMMMKEMMYRQGGENGDMRGGYDSEDRSDEDTQNGMIYDHNGKHEFSDDQPSIDESNVAQYVVPEMTESGLPPPPMKRLRLGNNDDHSLMSSFQSGGYNQYSMQNEGFPKMDKYNKFGQFIASSLADLPEEQALALIEKFTLDVVGAMRNNLTN